MREVAALLADCSAALKDEPCVLGKNRGKHEQRRAVVVIRGAAAQRVAIWVHHGDSLISYRELKFDERDETAERWRSAGLVAASLLLAPSPNAESPPAPEPEPEPAIDAKPPAAPPPRPPRREQIGVSLAVSAGTWASNAPVLLGGAVGLELFPLSAPVGLSLSGEASQGLAKLGGSATVSRQSLGLGVVTFLPERSALRLTFRGQVLRERLAVRATNSAGANDSGETWGTAGSLALAPTLAIGRRLSAHLGAQVTLHDAAPQVFSGRTSLAQASRVTASAFVGIRVGF